MRLGGVSLWILWLFLSSFPLGEPTEPTANPTAAPTANPTRNPTVSPTPRPSREPTAAPTAEPTQSPTPVPTLAPTAPIPTVEPTPGASITAKPTPSPTKSSAPTSQPSGQPTANPTSPTGEPTSMPSIPTGQPTSMPSTPTNAPNTPMPSRARDTLEENDVDKSRKHYCPYHCMGNGVCKRDGCHCFPGFTGIDCSIRVCPAGRAWFGLPLAVNADPHLNFTECSNMGHCNRATGVCKCRDGFGGPACDKMNCPIGLNVNGIVSPCYGNGQCISLRTAAAHQDYNRFTNATMYNGWDADMMYGCACDAGFTGVACNQISCPLGVDPLDSGVYEEQNIDCRCDDAGGCTGGMRITFRGETTHNIPYQSSAAAVKRALEQLSSVEMVTVQTKFGTSLCDSTDGSITMVRFILPAGTNLPEMTVEPYGSFNGFMDVKSKGAGSDLKWGYPTVAGTKLYTECSSRGICDRISGLCQCFPGYSSSDGMGNAGKRGDCALRNSTSEALSLCPIRNNKVCSGHGTCNDGTDTCECNEGYEGGDCSLKSCGVTRTLFGDIKPDRSGKTTCSGVGDCDHATGLCTNCGGSWGYFTGDSCEMMSCSASTDPSDGNFKTCAGNGVCMSLREYAPYAYNNQKELSDMTYTSPWDADWVRGCACFRAVSVDNQYYTDYKIPTDGTSFPTGLVVESSGEASLSDVSLAYDLTKFYRGPYAYTATDWTSYTCSHAKCPKGDDPTTPVGVDEIQELSCRADAGAFQVFFRENVTTFIDYDATAAEFETHLEELYTINNVDVTLYSTDNTITASTAICNNDATQTIQVRFLTEFGDLPLMQIVSTSAMTLTGGTPAFSVTEVQKGTKEDLECSGNGICLPSGICRCMPGYMSSNGTSTMVGEKGDCTYWNPLFTEHSNP